MKIGKILKSNRERLGIDISEIVEKQEFKSIHYINSVENDIIKTPLDVLMIYCEVLNISPNEILGWKHNRRLVR